MIALALSYLAKPLIKWGIVALVIAGLGIALYVEHTTRVAAEKGEKAAEAQIATYAANSAAMAETHTDDVATINVCKSALSDQSAAIARLQFSFEQTNAAASKQQAESTAETNALNDRILGLEEEAQKAPADVRALGPIVLKRVPHLFDKDTPPGA